MNLRTLTRDFGLVRQICAPAVFSPSYTSVRFAKRRVKPSKHFYHLTDAAQWRQNRGLDVNPNRFGPLTNLPDYSFLDGRPVPIGANLKKRLEKQQEYAEAIVRLSGEIDFAKERYQTMQAEQSEFKRTVVGNKLKRKGRDLLKNKDAINE